MPQGRQTSCDGGKDVLGVGGTACARRLGSQEGRAGRRRWVRGAAGRGVARAPRLLCVSSGRSRRLVVGGGGKVGVGGGDEPSARAGCASRGARRARRLDAVQGVAPGWGAVVASCWQRLALGPGVEEPGGGHVSFLRGKKRARKRQVAELCHRPREEKFRINVSYIWTGHFISQISTYIFCPTLHLIALVRNLHLVAQELLQQPAPWRQSDQCLSLLQLYLFPTRYTQPFVSVYYSSQLVR